MEKPKGVYAVKVGRTPGLYHSWSECERQVKGFSGGKHKKFRDVRSAQAWLDEPGGGPSSATAASSSRMDPRRKHAAAPYSVPDRNARITRKAISRIGETPLADDAVVVYTDGATKNNQDARARVAGYGIHWQSGRPASVQGDIAARCPGASDAGKTNNFGELLAITRTLELMQDDPRPLHIRSDSKYSIDCFQWVHRWRANGWAKADGRPIANLALIRYMDALRTLRAARGHPFEIRHVKGHATDAGNIRADALANAGTRQACAEPEHEPDWDACRARVEAEIARVRPAAGASRSDGVRAAADDVGIDSVEGFGVADLLSTDEMLAELDEA